jgi:hypothetical protein
VTIRRAPKIGGAVTTLVDDAEQPTALAVDATTLYYAELNAARVMKVPKLGGTPVALATGLFASSIALDTTTVYFGACEGACAMQSVMAVPKNGGQVVELLTKDTNAGDHAITVGPDHLFWAGRLPPEGSSTGVLAMVPRSGGPATDLVTGPDMLAVAVEPDESAVYWVDFDTGEVGRTELH